MKKNMWLVVVVWALAVLPPGVVSAQEFDCGSNGSDGVLDFVTGSTDPVTIEFDPNSFDPPLDTDIDGVYHFTSVNVPSHVTVKFIPTKAGWGPVYWLCSGDVVIDGVLDLSGQPGHPASDSVPGQPSIPGPGGFPGGWGGCDALGITYRIGFGPGETGEGGDFSGNLFLQPLIGGNGGSGGSDYDLSGGGGGGAGGGAMLIAANGTITLNGQMLADGGNGGAASSSDGGYGGAGGGIRLIAPEIKGNGLISTNRGTGCREWGYGEYFSGDYGVVRLEAQTDSFTGSLVSDKARRITLIPNAPIGPPPEGFPFARLARINGIELPLRSRASFSVPDVVINTPDAVLFEIEAKSTPLGTTFTICLWNETMREIDFQSNGLAGTLESSKATVTHVIPHGYTRGFIYATWTNQ